MGRVICGSNLELRRFQIKGLTVVSAGNVSMHGERVF